MKLRQFSTERGMTLVELLAALSLFAVVIALSSTVIFQMVNGEEKTNDNLALKQDTNVLISEFRDQYYKGENKLCFSKNNTDLVISEYTIINGEYKSFNANGNCLLNIDNEQSLDLNMTFHSIEGDQKINIKTYWERKNDLNLQITLNNECKGNNNPDCNEEDENNDKAKCRYYGSFVFNNLTLENGYCSNRYEVEGSMVIRNHLRIEEDVTFKIFKAATHFQGNIFLSDGAKIITNGHSSFQVDGEILCGTEKIP